MGTLMGHILPGTFFAMFAVWWGFCVAVKHFYSYHSKHKSRKPIPYRATTTFTCLCCPPSLRQVALESYLKIICVTIGILGEAVTGVGRHYDDTLKRNVWTFVEVNAQHIAMFFSFGFASFIEILANAKYNIPKGSEFIANVFAFGVEGFLFHFHLHGRDEIDIHVHTLLVYNIGFCMLAGIWEFTRPNQIIATYCRVAATLLQGIWFYAVGFILYFPSNDPYWIWSPTHGHILILTVMFIWFGLFTFMFLFIQSAVVWSILKRRYRDTTHYNMLHEDDDDDHTLQNGDTMETSDNHQLKSLKKTNGNTTIDMLNHDDDESDSEIEFDREHQLTSKI